jgi:GNAT superfamily N-acetyltransferase
VTGLAVRAATLAEIMDLRHRELRPGLARHTAEFEGDDDEGTRHFGAFLAATGENVGCLSLMPRPWEGAPAFQLRGMATRADLTRRGVGRVLLRFADEAIRAEGGPGLFWCNARVEAAPFYLRLGWAIVSDAFDIPGVGPHYRMLRR